MYLKKLCTKDRAVARTNDRDFVEDVDVVEDESLYNSWDMEENGLDNVVETNGDDLEEYWKDMDLAIETVKVLLPY
jgi:hypothetical protein